MSLILLLFPILFRTLPSAYGSACCGGAARFPGTISPSANIQLNFLVEYNDFIYEHISADGIWHPNTKKLSIETYRFEYSQWFNENWQYSVAIPFLKRNSMLDTSQGLGDIQLNLGFAIENLSTLLFAQLFLPTGLNRYNAELGPLHSRGRGQWALGVGYQYSYLWKKWDLIHSAQLQFIKSQTFFNNYLSYKVDDNFAHSILFGGGYHLAQFRLGAQIIHFYQNPSQVQTQSSYNLGLAESWTSLGLTFSWIPNHQQTWIIQLQDQTRIGWPQNTNVGWISSIQFVNSW